MEVNGKSISLCLILYGTLCLRSVRDSVYWYTASVLYVWPLLPFLGCIWLAISAQRKETRLRKYRKVFVIACVFAGYYVLERMFPGRNQLFEGNSQSRTGIPPLFFNTVMPFRISGSVSIFCWQAWQCPNCEG